MEKQKQFQNINSKKIYFLFFFHFSLIFTGTNINFYGSVLGVEGPQNKYSFAWLVISLLLIVLLVFRSNVMCIFVNTYTYHFFNLVYLIKVSLWTIFFLICKLTYFVGLMKLTYFLNPAGCCCLSIPPENIRKPKDFLVLSGSIDKQHLTVMGFPCI